MRLRGLIDDIKRQFYRQQVIGIAVVVIVAGIGTYLLVASHAATPFASSEAENGTLANGATTIADSNASNGSAVQFGTGTATGTPGNCPGLPDGTAAFCDTFDKPEPNGERSGDLSSVWGTSRSQAGYNSGQGWADSWVTNNVIMTGSCGQQVVQADNDIKICNGQLNDAVNDNPTIFNYPPSSLYSPALQVSPFVVTQGVNPINPNDTASLLATDGVDDAGGVSALTMYPKQPFSFGGRNARVVFDVSDDSAGMHAAWPEFWITDKPVPNPFNHFSSWQSDPQNGFGIRLGTSCGVPNNGCEDGPNCDPNNTGLVVTVNDVATVNNYVNDDPDNEVNPGSVVTTLDNCVKEPTQAGQLNHFEIDIHDTDPSNPSIDVCGTDAGVTVPTTVVCGTDAATTTAPLKHLATITNLNLDPSFTKGLIWLVDAHYNACKSGLGSSVNGNQYYQCDNTFTWDNVGFDGPVLNRDLAFEVPDALTTVSGYPDIKNLGWFNYGNGGPNTITVTDHNVSGMNNPTTTGGLLVFHFFNLNAPVNFTYALNGNPSHTVDWPFSDTLTDSPRTIAIPISLSELVTGDNKITISDNDAGGLFVDNVGLVIVGAGGPGGVVTYP